MPLSLETTFIEVCYQAGDVMYICGAKGPATTSMLCSIEDGLDKDKEHYFDKGDGNYLFEATWGPAQYSKDGRCELPMSWDLDLVRFVPVEQG